MMCVNGLESCPVHREYQVNKTFYLLSSAMFKTLQRLPISYGFYTLRFSWYGSIFQAFFFFPNMPYALVKSLSSLSHKEYMFTLHSFPWENSFF